MHRRAIKYNCKEFISELVTGSQHKYKKEGREGRKKMSKMFT
jgi:hypothetical protein